MIETIPAILIVEDDVLVRSAVASYLRECGYAVIEAATEVDAKTILSNSKHDVDIVICSAKDITVAEAFSFSRWIRSAHQKVRVLLAATVEKTAKLAADICEEGPHLRKPYDHQALLQWIKLLRR
jgi:DNA-binding response OmpR family regulator